MKTWLKGGLVGAGVYLVIAMIAFFSKINLLLSAVLPVVLIFRYFFIINYITLFIFSAIVGFVIGSIIGLITGKIKSKNMENQDDK